MNILEDTGRISLPEIGAFLSPALSRSQLLETPAFASASALVKNEPWCSYRLPGIAQADSVIHFILQFHGERLVSLRLSHDAARFGMSWSEWSEERELARKAFHEHWLAHELCVRLGHYSWGDIASQYDAKSGSSSITITYADCNA